MIKTYVEGSEIIRGLGSNMKKYHSRPPPRESPGYTISNPLVVGGIIYLSIYLPTYLPIPIYLSTCKFENEAILRDFLHFRSWQHQKRSNSARRPQLSNLTTSETKQFCETSFKNRKLSAELTASYQCVLRFFYSICVKCCACHEKVMPGHAKCCACQAKSS